MKRYILETVVFFCGGVVMAYEIIGARMLGPFVGTSITVWTSIIGVILLSLSAGYYLGGKLADKYPDHSTLSLIIFSSGIIIVLATLTRKLIIQGILNTTSNLEMASLLSSLILFSIPAILLGMVSPYAAKLKIEDINKSGATAGYLYALSTIGSITGTFMAGFVLIPTFAISTNLYLIALILFLCSGLLLLTRRFTTKKI
ncbi:MAG: fused MFS/spermidine synthase [Bacteroidales bacterium]|nr:fused MFS/spermidine synthase [Bacteroidales bacterium]MCF8403860.1 fused MFS/spermidine synthase [Bacteroidales bacterium]